MVEGGIIPGGEEVMIGEVLLKSETAKDHSKVVPADHSLVTAKGGGTLTHRVSQLVKLETENLIHSQQYIAVCILRVSSRVRRNVILAHRLEENGSIPSLGHGCVKPFLPLGGYFVVDRRGRANEG